MEMSASSVGKMHAALIQTLSDCQLRSEVEDCMKSVLLDVETAFSLEQQLSVHSNQQAVDILAREQKATILDAEAERSARDEERLQLADQFVTELMTLSRELETLLHWKSEHEHKVNTYDELVAKLVQTEEELEVANRVSYGGSPIARQPTTVETDETKTEETQDVAISKQTSEIVLEDTTNSEKISPDSQQPGPGEFVNEESKKTPAKPVSTEDGLAEDTELEKQITVAHKTEPMEESSPAVAVVLDEEEAEVGVPNLVEIDMEILMNVFGFLDAIDILNTAQTNIIMYTRVDSIFGIAEDGHSMPQPTAKKPPTEVKSAPVAPKPAPAVTKPSTAAAPADSTSTGMGLFSMLQPARMPAIRSAAQPSKGGRPPQMNASLAKSMASKLTDAELAAIISMTDKLSKLDKEVNLLRNEKEVLTAKLDGTESVKQFLIAKVRDVEVKLKKREEDDVKITQQIASDQEVIAFLDTRVQELEKVTEDITKERTLIQSELDSLKVSSSKKTIMLNDMLKYEREKLREDESEWKATKKVLVKEVKNCRGQILALQAERDGFKEQNEMLKRAIVSTGKNLPSPSK
eukprot:scaffold22592_cov129-Cylindrotheca_fusiformis.AAC.8